MIHQSSSNTPIALTLPAAAKAVGVSSRTLQKFIASGALPSVLLGKRRVVRVTDLQDFLASRIDTKAGDPSAGPASV